MENTIIMFNSKILSILARLQGWLLPIGLVLLWSFLSHRSQAYGYVFVPLPEIASGFIAVISNHQLLYAAYGTLHSAIIGLVIGAFAGLATGSVMGMFRSADLLIGPLYHTLRQVPLLGLIPLIGLWLGNGEASKLLIVSLAAFYPMVLNTCEGIRHVDRKYLEVGSIFQLNAFQRFSKVILPAALPSILTGLLHALAFAWISTIGSELLFTTGLGLGGLMETAQTASRMDLVVVCIFSIGIIGLLLNFGLQRLIRHWLRWRQAH
jgi:sulfonate transport system permease protein